MELTENYLPLTDDESRELRGVDITVAVNVCTACGCLVGKDDEDWERHQNWHRLLCRLTTGEDPSNKGLKFHPQALSTSEVEALMAACSPTSPTGRGVRKRGEGR